MTSDRLKLYHLDPIYVEELAEADHNVMSVSPREGKANRPFVGVVIPCGDTPYCIPLSSPKPKHEHMKTDRDFMKIKDRHGRLIGVLNLNNMVPVEDSVLMAVDLHPRPADAPADRAYKNLMRDQLRWCNAHRDGIRSKAAKLYRIVVERPESAPGLVRRCCDFGRLESVLASWRVSGGHPSGPQNEP